jgi:hypothetical protein
LSRSITPFLSGLPCWGRIAADTLIEWDERSLLKSDPEHYHNFRQFKQDGGLRAWALAQPHEIVRQQDYWGGTVELVVFRQLVHAHL